MNYRMEADSIGTKQVPADASMCSMIVVSINSSLFWFAAGRQVFG